MLSQSAGCGPQGSRERAADAGTSTDDERVAIGNVAHGKTGLDRLADFYEALLYELNGPRHRIGIDRDVGQQIVVNPAVSLRSCAA